MKVEVSRTNSTSFGSNFRAAGSFSISSGLKAGSSWGVGGRLSKPRTLINARVTFRWSFGMILVSNLPNLPASSPFMRPAAFLSLIKHRH